jgi:hypothetical protein
VPRRSLARAAFILTSIALVTATPARAQESAYFVTYDHYLEESGNIEIGLATTTGIPKNNQSPYHAPWLELEYGVSGWWTTELYLEGVASHRDGSGPTGWRWENRFRPFRGEHRINPVLYVEFEDINEGSRIQKEIVGSGGIKYEPIAQLRASRARELEAKLILSSRAGAWNIAENFIAEKNLSEDEGIEFGYSVGVSRPIGLIAKGAECRFCAENVVVGMEVYGGLGSTLDFGRVEQRHYAAPVIAWRLGGHSTLKASVGAGLTKASDRLLVRVGYVYEFATRGRK